MAAAAHNPKFAKEAGIPQSVAKEFHAADKARGGYYGAGKQNSSGAKRRSGKTRTWSGA